METPGCKEHWHNMKKIMMETHYEYTEGYFLGKGKETKKQNECASDLNDPEHQNEFFRLAKQMVKERQDITGSNCLKGVSGKLIVDEKGIKDSWKEYMEKLMNEENEWDHGISAEVKKHQQIASGW